jgi:hypothetical protein
MVENGYTEYNTAAALQRGQMIDIYIGTGYLYILYRVNDNNLQVHYNI